MNEQKNLIFDINITGHHSEYIGHLVNFLFEKKMCEKMYFFVVHPQFSEKFPVIFNKAKQAKNIVWEQIDQKEFDSVNGNSIQTSLASYRILQRYAQKFEVDHVCALDFHTIKYGIIFHRTPYTISGILFVQFHRLSRTTFNEKWTYLKRYTLTKLTVNNRKLIRIFVLNDQKTVEFMNAEFKTDIFKVLPDPIPRYKPLENFDIHKTYGIYRSRRIFLHIGSLGDRKGTLETVKAAQFVPETQHQRVTILLVGKASAESERKAITRAMEKQRKKTGVQIVWDERFVPNSMMKSLFNQCYAVLLPYKNAEYSSGILGHAAEAHKMVIATGKGLLKEIILKNGLGILIDAPSAIEISKGISKALAGEHKLKVPGTFVKNHSPKVFARTVLNIIPKRQICL